MRSPLSLPPQAVEDLGAGEILLNCIDCDGVGQGFDIELVAAVSGAQQGCRWSWRVVRERGCACWAAHVGCCCGCHSKNRRRAGQQRGSLPPSSSSQLTCPSLSASRHVQMR